MKTNFLVLILLFLLLTSCDKNTNAPSRYIIIESTIAMKGTYKFDTFTGAVFQLKYENNENTNWNLIQKKGNLSNDTKKDNTTNYQLFLSNFGMRDTYLLNVNTGATWKLVYDSQTKEKYFESSK